MTTHGTYSQTNDTIKNFYKSDFFQRLLNDACSIATRNDHTYRLFQFGSKVGGWKLVGNFQRGGHSPTFAVVIGYKDELVEMITDEGGGCSIGDCYRDIQILSTDKGCSLSPFEVAYTSAPQEVELMEDIRKFLDNDPVMSNTTLSEIPFTLTVSNGTLIFSRHQLGNLKYVSIKVYDKDRNLYAYIFFGDNHCAAVDIIGARTSVADLRKFFVIQNRDVADPINEEGQLKQDDETLALKKLLEQFEPVNLWQNLIGNGVGAFNSDLGFDVIRPKEQETAEDDMILDFYQLQPSGNHSYKIATVTWRRNGETSVVYHVGDEMNPKQSLITILGEMVTYPTRKKQQEDSRQPTTEDQWNAILARFKKTTLFRTMFSINGTAKERTFLDYQCFMCKPHPGDQHTAFFMQMWYKGQRVAEVKFPYNGNALIETYSDRAPGFNLLALTKAFDYLVEAEETRDRNGETWGPLPTSGHQFGAQTHRAEEPVFVNLSTGELNDDWVNWYSSKNKCGMSRSVCVGMHRLENLAISINNNLDYLKKVEE